MGGVSSSSNVLPTSYPSEIDVTLRSIFHFPSAFPESRMQAVVKHDDQQQCEDLEAALALALDEDEASTCSVEASEAARQPREDLQAGMKENDDMNVRVKHSFSMSSVFGVLPDVRSSNSPPPIFCFFPLQSSLSLPFWVPYYLAIHHFI